MVDHDGNCSSLTSITCKAEILPTIDGSYTFYNVSKSIPVYVRVDFVADYQIAKTWEGFSNIKPKMCLLTYMLEGEVYKAQSIAYDSAITTIPAPTKEGHTFSGWSEAPETMPAHDVTYTANIANGIDAMSTDNGEQSTVIYDLMGRKVTDTENLKSGVYIVNGRKVIVNN